MTTTCLLWLNTNLFHTACLCRQVHNCRPTHKRTSNPYINLPLGAQTGINRSSCWLKMVFPMNSEKQLRINQAISHHLIYYFNLRTSLICEQSSDTQSVIIACSSRNKHLADCLKITTVAVLSCHAKASPGSKRSLESLSLYKYTINDCI